MIGFIAGCFILAADASTSSTTPTTSFSSWTASTTTSWTITVSSQPGIWYTYYNGYYGCDIDGRYNQCHDTFLPLDRCEYARDFYGDWRYAVVQNSNEGNAWGRVRITWFGPTDWTCFGDIAYGPYLYDLEVCYDSVSSNHSYSSTSGVWSEMASEYATFPCSGSALEASVLVIAALAASSFV